MLVCNSQHLCRHIVDDRYIYVPIYKHMTLLCHGQKFMVQIRGIISVAGYAVAVVTAEDAT